jgi:hypothetical protein
VDSTARVGASEAIDWTFTGKGLLLMDRFPPPAAPDPLAAIHERARVALALALLEAARIEPSDRGSSAARPRRNRARHALEATRREVRRVLELTAGG